MSGFDFSQFFAKSNAAHSRGLDAAVKALDEFGEHVLGQAQELAPVGGGSHSPRDPAPGTLKASAASDPAETQGSKIVKTIGFNTEYAAVQHENLDFGHDSGQAKYLEQPLKENTDKFSQFVSKWVKEATEG